MELWYENHRRGNFLRDKGIIFFFRDSVHRKNLYDGNVIVVVHHKHCRFWRLSFSSKSNLRVILQINGETV